MEIRGSRTALAALRLMLAGVTALQAAAMPDLTGTWQLNKDASDDPAKVMKEARSSGGGRGGGSGGGMGGMGMGHGGHGHGSGGRGGDRGENDGGAQSAEDWFAALTTLKIEHSEPRLAITDAAGHERVVYTDGRKVEEERSHGGTTVVIASWKDGRVQIVSTPETGSKITETFAVTADRTQLTVTTKLEGGRAPAVTIRRVYDAAGAPAGSPQPPRPPAAPEPRPSPPDSEDWSVSAAR